MGISLSLYRAAIGLFNNERIKIMLTSWQPCLTRVLLYMLILALQISPLIAGDIERNPGPKVGSLLVGHINARSIAIEDKFDEISSFILDKEFDIFAVSETWLNSKIPNDHLGISGYYPIFRKDRLNMRGGGVAVYALQSLAVRRRYDLENNMLELLWIEIKMHKLTVLCGVSYRPPNNSFEETETFG
jgi:hypothetical protein